MSGEPLEDRYTLDALKQEAAALLALIRGCSRLSTARQRLFGLISDYQYYTATEDSGMPPDEVAVARDCAHALRSMCRKSSDEKSGFSVTRALWDIAKGQPPPDLEPGFYAEVIHLVQGIEQRSLHRTPGKALIDERLRGRRAAQVRSDELDRMWEQAAAVVARYPSGLDEDACARREARRGQILEVLGGGLSEWSDWRWQVRNIVRDADLLARLVPLGIGEFHSIREAQEHHLPFGVTPYYVSLMDEDPTVGRDRAVRAQVLPPADYVREMSAHRSERERSLDFMLERDTSPVDLVTRRYPAIAIIKPFNTCPQICVYCQRNWEIDDAMADNALASPERLEAACAWIEEHPAIREVLITGGDPLALSDSRLERLLERIARIPSVDLIRIGSRVPVTMPMRITPRLAELLALYRHPGRREVCLVTHVEHVYELTPEVVLAVDRLRRGGIAVYNQLVYHFYVSRRFEAASLRLLLRRVGIDPYYTFVPKGKEETRSYRVPLARVLQEQKEEARLLPGLRRTDEAVFNVPGLGKNHLLASQHRDLLSILPNGARVYEFHPWEKMVQQREHYVGIDVPILDYLGRLAELGEDPDEYASIWHYY